MKYSTHTRALLFIILFIFGGCHKADHSNYNPYTIAEAPIVEEDLNLIATDHSIILFGLLSKVALGMISNPVLYGLTGDLPAVTRTGCPCISFSDPIGTYPNTLTATFDNCQAGATYDHTYDGVITIVANAPINSNVAGPELTISTTDFTFTNSDGSQSFDINTSAPIELNYAPDFSTTYKLNLMGDVTIMEGSNITTYFSGTQISFKIIADSNDNVDDPSTYIDNALEFTTTAAGSGGWNSNGRLINCSNGNSSENICIGGFGIGITPFSCGCPRYGVLLFINVINNSSCGNNQVAPQLRFGWSSNDPCDNLTYNGIVVTACGS